MNSTMTFLAVIAGVLLLCALIGARNERERSAALRRKLEKEFGAVPAKKMSALRYEKVPAYYLRHLPEDGIDDITWNDLDMDAVFARLDSTRSGAGEEYLYALLRSPVRRSRKEDSIVYGAVRREQIRYYEEEENTESRIAMQTALTRFGHSGSYSIYDYLDQLKEVRTESNLRHLPAFLLPALSLALLYVSVPAGIVCLVASLCLNMVTYYRRRGEIEPYIVSFSYLLRMLRCADEIAAVSSPPFADEQEELRRLRSSFDRFRRWSGILLSGSAMSSGNPIDILVDYVRILFHIDLIKFNTMLAEAEHLQDEIDAELTILGKVDAAIALASFEKSLPYTCEPQLRDSWGRERGEETGGDAPGREHQGKLPGGRPYAKDAGQNLSGAGERDIKSPEWIAEGLYHPLLDQPVPNDIAMTRSILLTGSNASGKSTFLKAIALCTLFAQTIGFCPARRYEGSVFRIRSSMALRDSIQRGESYFMVEIKSLKRIADLTTDHGRPVLCCIDEVLRGTNTIERIAASTEILTTLADRGVLCCAATHDVELSVLLEKRFDNYHFEEELRQGDVAFSYQLHSGRATSRNAIRLLEAVGFEGDITSRAQQRAARFERTGDWTEGNDAPGNL